MKKLIFITITLAFATVGVFAQNYNSTAPYGVNSGGQPITNPDPRAKDETDKINNIVQLSADQYTRVYAVNRNFFEQPHSGFGGKRSAVAASGRDQQLQGILTPDQWQRLQAAKAQGQWQ